VAAAATVIMSATVLAPPTHLRVCHPPASVLCAFSVRGMRGRAGRIGREGRDLATRREVATPRRVRCNVRMTGGLTHEEKLARGRAILAAYRTWLRCVVAVRGDARRCEVWLMRVCVCVCVSMSVCVCACVLTLNPKP